LQPQQQQLPQLQAQPQAKPPQDQNENNSFFDPLSIYNEITNGKKTNNSIPSKTNLNTPDKTSYETYKSFGPLGIKYSQLKNNNLDLLKSAFSGLKNIGLDVSSIAKSAMSELKKNRAFNPDLLKDINNNEVYKGGM